MRIVLPREEFLEAVSWTARILPLKPYTPVLGGVYIIADGGDPYGETHFCAYDTEVSAEMQAKAKIEEDGEALVSGRLLAAISKVLPKGDVELRTVGTALFLRCGKAEFTLPTMPVAAYPKLPELPAMNGTVDGDELATAMSQVLPATSQDQAQPHLCAVYVAVEPGVLTLWSTDKHRLAMRRLAWEGTVPEPVRLLIPARAAAEMGHLGGQKVHLGFDPNAKGILGICAGARMTTTRLMDGEYPNCKAILPKTHNTVVVVDTDEMRGALQRALLLEDGEFPQVKFTPVNDGDIQIHAGTQDVGSITDIIPAETRGPGWPYRVNPRYLLDALAACRSDKVAMGFTASLKPVLMAPFKDWPESIESPNDTYGFYPLQGDYLHVVMPMLPGSSQ